MYCFKEGIRSYSWFVIEYKSRGDGEVLCEVLYEVPVYMYE